MTRERERIELLRSKGKRIPKRQREELERLERKQRHLGKRPNPHI